MLVRYFDAVKDGDFDTAWGLLSPSYKTYTGITWARKFDGAWLYDQGYLQSPARAAYWRPRSDRTLGVRCDDTGY